MVSFLFVRQKQSSEIGKVLHYCYIKKNKQQTNNNQTIKPKQIGIVIWKFTLFFFLQIKWE